MWGKEKAPRVRKRGASRPSSAAAPASRPPASAPGCRRSEPFPRALLGASADSESARVDDCVEACPPHASRQPRLQVVARVELLRPWSPRRLEPLATSSRNCGTTFAPARGQSRGPSSRPRQSQEVQDDVDLPPPGSRSRVESPPRFLARPPSNSPPSLASHRRPKVEADSRPVRPSLSCFLRVNRQASGSAKTSRVETSVEAPHIEQESLLCQVLR